MPNTLIGIDRWMRDNRSTMESLLDGVFTGGDQVKYNAAAFKRAAALSADVYKEADAAYWEKYFRVVREQDKTGQMVELGGSSVNNLADNITSSGWRRARPTCSRRPTRSSETSWSRSTPTSCPATRPSREILDTSYVQALAKRGNVKTEADLPKFATATG
jgi:hypothetical protein